MINGKNYYQILGVLQDAEDIVIKAAYKVLAQKYHPDKWNGDAREATSKMSAINQAYSVLSDFKQRADYDQLIGRQEYTETDVGDLDSDDQFLRDWESVLEYFPDLAGICRSLRAISSSLEQTYKLSLMEGKRFKQRVQIAEQFERDYLGRYFGSNPKLVTFARFCINQNERSAARELNRAVNLLGDGIDPDVVIKKILKSHFQNSETLDFELVYPLLISKPDEIRIQDAIAYLKHVGAQVSEYGFYDRAYKVWLNGEHYYFEKQVQIKEFAQKQAKKKIGG